MKKIISMISVLLLLLSVFTANVYAAENTVVSDVSEDVIYIQQGESYLFQNITSTYAFVKWPRTGTEQIKDYISYQSNGTIFTWYSGSNSNTIGGSVSCYPNGSVIVTGVSEEPVEIRYDPNIFVVSVSKNPAVYRVYVPQGESYSLTNRSTTEYVTVKWAKNVGKMSYSVYKANGSLHGNYTSDLSLSLWSSNIMPGGTVVFNIISAETPVEFTCPYSIYGPLN